MFVVLCRCRRLKEHGQRGAQNMAGVEGLGGWICFAALRAVKRKDQAGGGNKRGHPSRIQEARTHGRWTGECEERTGNERNLSDEGGQQGREQGQARSKASAELLIAWLVVVGECEVDELLLGFGLSQF